ncbi:Hypothetical_protein [Hexamita inflata]|uniref:Hypothetical_protein n=1 Tax=Hexamita inflata TaxID=28002 RepID=A0AA86QRK4_9EUKA|nr:Hypothetical protein HINF_LOCUS49407 [Hexamita inflata]
MTNDDMHKLYEVSVDEVSTQSRILFTPPCNMIKDPIIYLGKTENDMHEFVCEGFLGTYATEYIYLNTFCQYLTNCWESFYSDEGVVFTADTNRLSRSLRARIYAGVDFVFKTNDYKLQKILGYKSFDDNQIFKSEKLTSKVLNQENGKLESQEIIQIEFPRVMYIRGFKYLNLICYEINEFTHRENNQLRYILLRSYYDFQNGIYAELPSNYNVIFSSNSLARGIKISFQDENYRIIDLENEPFTLQLFINPSPRNIEKRAFMQETQEQFLKEQQDKIIQEKQKKDKIEKDKRDKEEKEKKKKDDDEKFEREKREQIERDQNMFGQFERFGKGIYEELSNMIKVKSDDSDNMTKQLVGYITAKAEELNKQQIINTHSLTEELKLIRKNLVLKGEAIEFQIKNKVQNYDKLNETANQQLQASMQIGNMLHNQTNFIVSEIQRHKSVDDLKESLQIVKEQNEIRQKNIENEKDEQIKTLLKIKQYDPKQIETCDKSIMILENNFKEIVTENAKMTENFQKLIDIKRNNNKEEVSQKALADFQESEELLGQKIQLHVQQIESEKVGIQNYVKTMSFSNEYDTQSSNHIQSEVGDISSIAQVDEERVQIF